MSCEYTKGSNRCVDDLRHHATLKLIANAIVSHSCGASGGNSPEHLAAARALGEAFHKNGISLVYGGGTDGVMGELAKTLVSLSGKDAVHGVIPEALLKYERKYGAEGIDAAAQAQLDENTYGRTTVVKDMHTRKQMMAREAIESGPGGGFVALTGGYGTMEELMEVVTWNQLGIHARGIVVFNVDGYYDGLLQWVRTAVSKGFISQSNAGIMAEGRTAEEVVDALKNYKNSADRFKLKWGEE